ncbi:MAG: D-alanyl-D-alanine carboxypeptidase [Chloroflexi bacterium]|nr:D-alanyl-D-alanine carboxypeptidase [Chloroflexota bacterium]
MPFLTRLFSLVLIVAVVVGVGSSRSTAASPTDPASDGENRKAEDQYAPPPAITANFAAVVEGDTGRVLYAKDLHQRAAPASLTKIVTALVALDRGRLTDIVKVDVDSKKMEIETNSSVMGLMPGEEITLEALLFGLLLPSGNDAAIAIAKHIAGSEQQFVQMMNDKVRQLGFTNTHFVNPHGLDAPDHYSTAYEMAMLGRYAMNNPTFAKIVATKEITIAGKQRKYTLENANALLWDYAGADGVKIGFTGRAKQAIVASAKRNGRRLFVTLIRSNARVSDSRALFDYFFANVEMSSAAILPATATATARPTGTPALRPALTFAWTSTPVPTATSTPSATPTSSATPSPTATDTPVPTPVPAETDKVSKQTSWQDAFLSFPWRVVQVAFSLIGGLLPH